MINRVKGTQDFLDMRLLNFFIDTAKTYLGKLSFKEITTPLIEHAELFLRTLGNETDVVSKQMYMLATHDDEKLCLRPEGTASIMRAYLEAHPTVAPWRVFTYGPMFRYERPQKGRYRQFNQLSMELIHARSVYYDASFIESLYTFFKKQLMLDGFDLYINFLGCKKDRQDFKQILKTFLEHKQLCATCTIRTETNILRIFDCKNNDCQILYVQAPKLTDSLCDSCKTEWLELQAALDALGVAYQHVSTLVRGLDYYNKTVFEFTSNHLGSQNAFCSGGRYDGLAQELGSKVEVPSIGAAMGIERILMILQAQEEKLSLKPLANLYALVPMDPAYNLLMLNIAKELHQSGVTTELLLDGDTVKAKMRKAHTLGAAYTLIVGSNEYAAQEVVLKNMLTGLEERVKQTDILDFILRK